MYGPGAPHNATQPPTCLPVGEYQPVCVSVATHNEAMARHSGVIARLKRTHKLAITRLNRHYEVKLRSHQRAVSARNGVIAKHSGAIARRKRRHEVDIARLHRRHGVGSPTHEQQDAELEYSDEDSDEDIDMDIDSDIDKDIVCEGSDEEIDGEDNNEYRGDRDREKISDDGHTIEESD